MRVLRQTVAGVDPPLVAAISQPVEDRSLRNTRPRALLANGRSQKLLPTTETDGSPDSPLEGNGFEISVPRCLATANSVGAFISAGE